MSWQMRTLLVTNLGSPGSLSQDCSPEIFSKLVFPHIYGLNECPVVAKPCVPFKKLNFFRPGCDFETRQQSFTKQLERDISIEISFLCPLQSKASLSLKLLVYLEFICLDITTVVCVILMPQLHEFYGRLERVVKPEQQEKIFLHG